MSVNPFALPGRFYRGNLHCHSTNSDGALPPEAVAASYREAGYDFMALTDHFLEKFDWPITDTRAFRTPGFTTLIGAELHAPKTLYSDIWHVLAVGLPMDFEPSRNGETAQQLAVRAREAGAFVAIAHPEWYGLTPEEARSLEAAHAVEVYNNTCWLQSNRAEGWYIGDGLLAEGRRINAIAVDDAHFKIGDFGGAWVQVKAEALEPEALLAALKSGAYYSSQGPEITALEITDEEIRVRCSPAQIVTASGRGYVYEQANGPARTYASFPLTRFRDGGYVRLTIVDDARRRAWTNPFWLD